MRLYKLTTREWKTRLGEFNETLWGPGVTHQCTGRGPLCSAGYIHAYTSPLLTVLLNPIHANIKDPILWECEGEVALSDGGLKVGCASLTTERITRLPEITTEQRVKFGILCATKVYEFQPFVAWANRWLSGVDRSLKAAQAAVWATQEAAVEAKVDQAASWAAARAEKWAAQAATQAAAQAAAQAARAEKWAAADAAVEAARAASWAAKAELEGILDLAELAREAVHIKD